MLLALIGALVAGGQVLALTVQGPTNQNNPLAQAYLGNLRGGAHRVDVNDPDAIMAAQFLTAQYAKDKKAPATSFDLQRINYAELHAITEDVVHFTIQMDLLAPDASVYRVVGIAQEQFGKGYQVIAINPMPT